jgi:hypothetical protein
MRHGIPIREVPINIKVDPDIDIDSPSGEVPLFEQREAAVFSHYNWTEWQQLTATEKAECIAHYKLHSLVEAHTNDALNAHAESERRKHEMR